MRVFFETSDTARSGARTGIQAVVRGLLAGISKLCEVEPLRWKFGGQCLTPVKANWQGNLDLPVTKKIFLPPSSLFRPSNWPLWIEARGMDYKAPIHLHPTYQGKLAGSWLIIAELIEEEHVRRLTAYARKHGMKLAGVFYDAIPWLHPEYCLHWTREQHAGYMSAFVELDVVIPISEQAARDYIQFVQEKKLKLPPVRACNLPAEIRGQPRETTPKQPSPDVVKILYVSTLEPRKNHALLIDAFADACAALPGVNVELHLVGGIYKSAPDIAEKVRAATQRNPRLFWHEKVGNEELRRFYSECDFTIYASIVEGFGLPIMESLWFGRPCICADTGVMAENARDGGCLTVDIRDRAAITEGIVRLASQPELRQKLAAEAVVRKLKTWGEYSAEVLAILRG
jgi:glycosyltransferase involved in cell wall biosynthesis